MGKEYRNWSLKQWAQMFEDIYGARNKEKTNEEILGHIFEETGRLLDPLGKSLESPEKVKEKLPDILINIPDIFAWHSAFSSRFGDLDDFLWSKFPNVCPYCVVEDNCDCISQSKMYSEEKEFKLINLRNDTKNKPKTMYDWQEMFRRIYGNVNKKQSLLILGLHLNEEVGEASKEFRLLKRARKTGEDIEKREKDLENELADIFAWLVGVTINCENFTDKELRLDDIIWDRYANKCPHCEYKPCIETCSKNGYNA